jgi:hypothetical protein
MVIGLNAPSGEAIFKSIHRDHKEHETLLIPMVKRANPFAARAQASEPGKVFFESQHREVELAMTESAVPGNGDDAAGSEESARDGARRRRGRRSRRGGGGSARSGNQPPAVASEGVAAEAPAVETASVPEPGNEKYPSYGAAAPARTAAPRRGRPRRRRPPAAATAG